MPEDEEEAFRMLSNTFTIVSNFNPSAITQSSLQTLEKGKMQQSEVLEWLNASPDNVEDFNAVYEDDAILLLENSVSAADSMAQAVDNEVKITY